MSLCEQHWDFFDNRDIVDEFELYHGKAHCYAYVSNDVHRAFSRFCYDARIPMPELVAHPSAKTGELIVFSDSIYSPENSTLRGRQLYKRMIEQLSFWGCHYLYGFIDCRYSHDNGQQLIQFYNSFDELGAVRILGQNEGFMIKEQLIL